jgi:hypothetical protein
MHSSYFESLAVPQSLNLLKVGKARIIPTGDEYKALKEAVPALRSFYEKVSGMLSGERDAESDDEVNGTGVAGVLRRIGWANREYQY